MADSARSILEKRLAPKDLEKLLRIGNEEVLRFVATYVELCRPSTVFVATDSEEDIRRTRELAVELGEEAPLANPAHTIHFDGFFDQARDKEHTKFLVTPEMDLGPEINTIDRDEGLAEVHGLLDGLMEGHVLFVKFFCLGPVNSPFSIPCLQLTDSAYVAHSEDILYRQGYTEFVRQGANARFWRFVHSQGPLEPAGLGLGVSREIEGRRIYIDLVDEVIYSTNTQYGGNTIGLKKLAMRLGIQRASKEGWLTEHMLVMGVRGPGGRTSYITGAFPSMCGKTSTAMINGESIVGDDIAYLRVIDGRVRAVNVESGIFGIIEGINDTDDPIQWKALHGDGEIIFSNVLVTPERVPYWNGKPGPKPVKGTNHSGEWTEGKVDQNGNPIPPSHKNARFTLRLETLPNADPVLHDPLGVEVKAFVYGGRDSDTSVPVEEALDWVHGIVTKGACLESETTAATLGREGVRVFNPMSNLDFLSIPIGRYILDNIEFGRKAEVQPSIFSVNYFLRRRDGTWLNSKLDKAVWLKWIELRANRDVEAIKTPTGYIPYYEDLRRLFEERLGKGYTREAYTEQFTLRIPENLAKIARMRKVFTERVTDTPPIVFEVLDAQERRLLAAQGSHGDYVSPEVLT